MVVSRSHINHYGNMSPRTQLILSVWALTTVVESVQGRSRVTCEEGWRNYGSKCYKEGNNKTTQWTAYMTCHGANTTLWLPTNEQENNHFINSTDADGDYFIDLTLDNKWWFIRGMGILRHMRKLEVYNNFGRLNKSNGCGVFSPGTGQWHLEDCNAHKNFMCEKKGVCAPGFFGPKCEGECHCAGQPCDLRTGRCASGCQAGWSGDTCSEKMATADGLFYCMEKPNGMHEVIFRVDLNNVNYRQMSAIDSQGNSVTSCGNNNFEIQDGVATIRINGSGSSLNPDCGARLPSNESTSWQFSFRQYPNITSKYDVIFDIVCFWKGAEKTQQSAKIEISGRQLEAERKPLEQSILYANVKLVEADSGKEVRKAVIGQKVRLIVDFENTFALAASDIAPYSCKATSVDGTASLAITDPKGCPMADSPVYLDSNATRVNGSVVYKSREFQVFSFPKHKHVVFTCQIQMCLMKYDPLCHFRCFNLRAKKRAVSEDRHQIAGTILDIRGPVDDIQSLSASN